MDLKNKKKIRIIFIVSIVSFSILIISINLINIIELNKNNKQTNASKSTSNSDDFNILEFWKNEIERVNNTDLNIEFEDNDTETFEYTNQNTGKEYEFEFQELYFDSPNWVGAESSTLKLHGYLFYPEKIEDENPGCLAMHGIGASAEDSIELAIPYLEKGFIVLCHSHPGHGDSEGPKLKPDNMIYEDDEEYNESAHFYLTLCGAIQGLRVLENLTIIDNSKIMITGASYGALNTMWLSGICGDRIAGALPYIMVGDFEKSLEDPTKLIFWLLGENAENIEEGSEWEDINLRFDPIYYLESEKLPPILWQVGTNDEFFHYHQIKGTYEAVENEDEAFLQIYPNAHHGFPGFENNTKFFIDYIIDNGPAPPKIDIKEYPKEYGILGNTMKIKIKLNSEEDIESVQVCYKYLDIVGSSWEVFELKKSGNIWTGLLGPGIITSKVDYYIIVNLEGEEDVWFSSIIYTPGTFISNFTIPFSILLGSFIALPIIYLIWRRFKIEFEKFDKKIQPKAKKNMLIEFITIGIAEILFYISLILPWIVFVRGDIIWTHVYIFNNIFTWKMIVGVFATYLTAIFIIGWILYSHLSFSKPMLSGLLKMIYPIFILLMFGIFISIIGLQNPEFWIFEFELIYPGIGIYLMLFASILVIIIGIWKRKYQTKLGIREPQTKWYNIDKWFKIKIPAKSKRNTKIRSFTN